MVDELNKHPDVVLFNVRGEMLKRVVPGVEEAFGRKPCQVFRPYQDDIASLMIADRKEPRSKGVFVLVDSKESDVRNNLPWCLAHLDRYLCREVLASKLLICMLGEEVDRRIHQAFKDLRFRVDKVSPPKKGEKPERFVNDLDGVWRKFLQQPEVDKARNEKTIGFIKRIFDVSY